MRRISSVRASPLNTPRCGTDSRPASESRPSPATLGGFTVSDRPAPTRSLSRGIGSASPVRSAWRRAGGGEPDPSACVLQPSSAAAMHVTTSANAMSVRDATAISRSSHIPKLLSDCKARCHRHCIGWCDPRRLSGHSRSVRHQSRTRSTCLQSQEQRRSSHPRRSQLCRSRSKRQRHKPHCKCTSRTDLRRSRTWVHCTMDHSGEHIGRWSHPSSLLLWD